ncbi:MAG: GntR family transcriptional regulator [Fretibacterium sp.]|nr:GntR family transcriptional regulator [Fretibacterium sp.]
MAEISTVIFEGLKKSIVSLAIKPGEKINEAEICERFSVTRPSVRSAFQRLQDIGLIDVVPYRGATTTLISLSSVHQMIFLRTAVESWIIRDFIASDPSPFILEELEHNFRMQKLHIQAEKVDENEFFRLDSAMHQFWFSKMRCTGIWDMIQNDINYERFRMLDFVSTLGYQEIVSDHEKLLSAIRSRRTDCVVPVLSSHLNAGLARMGNLIREDYRSYFALDDEDNDYWVHYNQSLLQHYPIG